MKSQHWIRKSIIIVTAVIKIIIEATFIFIRNREQIIFLCHGSDKKKLALKLAASIILASWEIVPVLNPVDELKNFLTKSFGIRTTL